MNYNFCIFIDKNFLARGLALYYSLIDHCPSFTLWVLCTDDDTFEVVEKLGLKNIKLLKMSDVEDERMRAVKTTRTPTEYIWMLGSRLSLYMLETIGVDMITFLDSDTYFYNSIEDIYREFGNQSIMIIPHRFSPQNIHRERTSGKYNVGMLIFRNDYNALSCLRWWTDRCIEWCFDRYEDGKFGDQLYLNAWPTRFSKVHILENLGVNVAPWNIDRFNFKRQSGKIIGVDKASGSSFPLIFYHFHGLKIYIASRNTIRAYPITIHNKYIYSQYLKSIQRAYDQIHQIDESWEYGCVKKLDILRIIKQYITIWIKRKYS